MNKKIREIVRFSKCNKEYSLEGCIRTKNNSVFSFTANKNIYTVTILYSKSTYNITIETHFEKKTMPIYSKSIKTKREVYELLVKQLTKLGFKEKIEITLLENNTLDLEVPEYIVGNKPKIEYKIHIHESHADDYFKNQKDYILEDLLKENQCVAISEYGDFDYFGDSKYNGINDIYLKDNKEAEKYIINKIKLYVKENNIKITNKKDFYSLISNLELDFSDFFDEGGLRILADVDELLEYVNNDDIKESELYSFLDDLFDGGNIEQFFYEIQIEVKGYSQGEYQQFNFLFNISDKQKQKNIRDELEGILENYFTATEVTLGITSVTTYIINGKEAINEEPMDESICFITSGGSENLKTYIKELLSLNNLPSNTKYTLEEPQYI